MEQTQRELVELLSHEGLARGCAALQRHRRLGAAVHRAVQLSHSVRQVQSADGRYVTRIGMLPSGGGGGTNYPVTLSVDDLGEEFRLTAQTDRPIDPRGSPLICALR